MIKEITHILDQVPSIKLEDLGAVDFDSRVDTKFIFHMDLLIPFLNQIKDDLVILEVDGTRFFQYENLYWDSADFVFFKKHHAGHGNRSKIRIRKYGDTGPVYFEVKKKSNKGLTTKYRIPLANEHEFRTEETTKVLKTETQLEFEWLSKQTKVAYKRITLTNKSLTEKLTIDFEMDALSDERKFHFKNLVVTEVKQLKYSSRSPFITTLKDLKVYSSSFSKYCTSVALLNKDVKQNRFLPIIRTINKIARA